MKTILSFFAATLFTANAFTQTSTELTCRAQAKELAMQTYSSCITQARNQQVENVRKSYQKELSSLKSKYDNELKKIGGGKAGKSRHTAPTAKGLSNSLPSKVVSTETIPVQDVPDQAKIVAVDTEVPTDIPKNEDAEANQVEIIDMPTE